MSLVTLFLKPTSLSLEHITLSSLEVEGYLLSQQHTKYTQGHTAILFSSEITLQKSANCIFLSRVIIIDSYQI